VFVYGSLMPGGTRWSVLKPHAVRRQPATARGRLYDTGHGFPAAIFDLDGHDIPGVLVDIRPDAWDSAVRILDRIEAEGELYRRVDVVTSHGPAIGYQWLLSTEGVRPLPSGWRPIVP